MNRTTILLVAISAIAAILLPLPGSPIEDGNQNTSITASEPQFSTIQYIPTPTPDNDVMESYAPKKDVTGLSEAEVRAIVRDEISKFKSQFENKASTSVASSGGSTGGSVSSVASPVFATTQQVVTVPYRTRQPVVSETSVPMVMQCDGDQCVMVPASSVGASASSGNQVYQQRIMPNVLPRLRGIR